MPEDFDAMFEHLLTHPRDRADLRVPAPGPRSREQLHELEARLHDLRRDFETLKAQLQAARDEASRWRTEAMSTAELLRVSTETQRLNLGALALHVLQRIQGAATVSQTTQATLHQVRALLSDTPEPLTLSMLDDLEEVVAELNAPPSDAVRAILESVTGTPLPAPPGES